MWGNRHKSVEIIKPTDAFSINGAHFIIAVGDAYAYKTIRLQLVCKHICEYSTFFFNSIGAIGNPDLAETARKSVLASAMSRLTGDETFNNPYADRVAVINDMFTSLRWSEAALDSYFNDFHQLHSPKKMLDIGPGFGVQSHILCSLIGDLDTSWICLSDYEKHEKGFVDLTN